MVITGTTVNFKFAPIFDRFDWLMALSRNDEYIFPLYGDMRFLTSSWLNGERAWKWILAPSYVRWNFDVG